MIYQALSDLLPGCFSAFWHPTLHPAIAHHLSPGLGTSAVLTHRWRTGLCPARLCLGLSSHLVLVKSSLTYSGFPPVLSPDPVAVVCVLLCPRETISFVREGTSFISALLAWSHTWCAAKHLVKTFLSALPTWIASIFASENICMLWF